MIESKTRITTEKLAADSPGRPGAEARRRLVAGIPGSERRRLLAEISTAVLEGGDGPPLLLLHGPAENATHWMRVIPDLVRTHRVVAPDLPGQGASELAQGALDPDRVLDWLSELIARTCPSPPTLIGSTLGGAIAARFAELHGNRLNRLVLVDTLGLRPFEPAPEFGAALHEFLGDPTEPTQDALWRRCARDLHKLRRGMGDLWEPFAAYHLDRARTPSVMAALGILMEHFGAPAIPEADLARIVVPTSLIWGRQDLVTPLRVAEAASERYGWPLRVIDDAGADPALEQPEAFLQALRTELGPA